MFLGVPKGNRTEFGPGGSEACDGGGRQLCEGRVALRELVRNGQHLGFRGNGNDSLTLQVAEDASARDWKGVRDSGCSIWLLRIFWEQLAAPGMRVRV